MSQRVGEVELAGTIAGPESAWPVSESALANALAQAGMPAGSLRLGRDGGRITIEPSRPGWSAADFGQEPGAALGAALRTLSGGARLSEDWGSTLRAVAYGEGQKVETLIGLAEDGVHAVSRSQAWQPVPQADWSHWVRRYGLIVALLTIALGGTLWLNRAEIQAWYQQAMNGAEAEENGPEDAAQPPA